MASQERKRKKKNKTQNMAPASSHSWRESHQASAPQTNAFNWEMSLLHTQVWALFKGLPLRWALGCGSLHAGL